MHTRNFAMLMISNFWNICIARIVSLNRMELTFGLMHAHKYTYEFYAAFNQCDGLGAFAWKLENQTPFYIPLIVTFVNCCATDDRKNNIIDQTALKRCSFSCSLLRCFIMCIGKLLVPKWFGKLSSQIELVFMLHRFLLHHSFGFFGSAAHGCIHRAKARDERWGREREREEERWQRVNEVNDFHFHNTLI